MYSYGNFSAAYLAPSYLIATVSKAETKLKADFNVFAFQHQRHSTQEKEKKLFLNSSNFISRVACSSIIIWFLNKTATAVLRE